jgi:hypothetical protein
VLEPKPLGNSEPVQALHKVKTGVRSKVRMVPAREMDPDGLVERRLNKGGNVDGGGDPVEAQGEDEKEADRGPGNQR